MCICVCGREENTFLCKYKCVNNKHFAVYRGLFLIIIYIIAHVVLHQSQGSGNIIYKLSPSRLAQNEHTNIHSLAQMA